MIILGFNKLKFFNLFSEYFIGIMLIYTFVVFILITSNIYGIIFQNIVSKIFAFLLILSSFFLFEDLLFSYSSNKNMNLFYFIGFNKLVSSNFLSIYSKIFVISFSFLYLIVISNYLRNYKIIAFEYLFILLFAVLGLLFLCCTNDLLSSFLAIELISLTSYFLSAFKKISSYSIEAGIKYLVVGALSSAFFLLGSSFIYGYSGSINFDDIYFLTADLNKLLLINNYKYLLTKIEIFVIDSNFYIELGIILILLSLFIKLALAPFHSWSIDVYEGSPSISTFFFSTITKLSFFIFLYRFCFITFNTNINSWFVYLLIVGVISVVVGSFGGLKQRKIKSLLAYSSVSHMGYSILALTSFSKFSFELFFFYIISYMLSNIIVWYVILSLKKVNSLYLKKDSKDLGDFILLSKSNNFLAFAFCVAFFSLAGIPPLVGFIAKLGIFLNLILEEFYLISLIVILSGTISTFYYLRVIKILYFENVTLGPLYHYDSSNCFILCFLVFLLVFLFFKPTCIYIIIHKMLLFENLN